MERDEAHNTVATASRDKKGVFVMNLYEMYVIATRADTALMRRRLARSVYARRKLRNRKLKKQYLHNQKESFDSATDIKRVGPLQSRRLP